jgi:hypothetical protein
MYQFTGSDNNANASPHRKASKLSVYGPVSVCVYQLMEALEGREGEGVSVQYGSL